jgi:hypothetical protein
MGRSLITVVMPDPDVVIAVGGGCAVLNGWGEVASDVYGSIG